MKILSEIWSRFLTAFIIFVGGLAGWIIVTVIFTALMLLIAPLIWVAAMVVILVRGSFSK